MIYEFYLHKIKNIKISFFHFPQAKKRKYKFGY